MHFIKFVPALLSFCFLSCKKENTGAERIVYGNSFVLTVHSNKSAYKPGETVNFWLNKPFAGSLKLRYKYLNEVLETKVVTENNWAWAPPQNDYKGYLLELSVMNSAGDDSIIATVAIDVSSQWSKFPRYGFLSNYGNLSEKEMNSVLEKLTRWHLNGLQYYDWQYKHHRPIAGTVENPLSVWKDIANKEVQLKTLKHYISEGKKRNIQSMFYNLAFGVLEDGFSEGVSRTWMLYKDELHTQLDKHALPAAYFKSSILVADAGNLNWQQYIANRNEEVYNVLEFDGYHVDALGDRGALYNYEGKPVDQQQSFYSFLKAMKQNNPSKYLVMNGVNQWGQKNILQGPVEFAYTEVWPPNDTYKALKDIIDENYLLSEGKATVLAAYMNYAKNSSEGVFNTPAVLLANAVIFASGGAHLELGEHMLGSEYFPNNNLKIPDKLSIALISYYDFLVAYQNLLRDGGEFTNEQIQPVNNSLNIEIWPSAPGRVASMSKKINNRQIFHLFNFSGNQSLNWRDDAGFLNKPETFFNSKLEFQTDRVVKKIWMASPDIKFGSSIELGFLQSERQVVFEMPSLKYWNMIVVEY